MNKFMVLFVFCIILSGCVAFNAEHPAQSSLELSSLDDMSNESQSAVSEPSNEMNNSNESKSVGISDNDETVKDSSKDDAVYHRLDQPINTVLEPKPLDSYVPSELTNWQEDPYNQGTGHRFIWNYVEYQSFKEANEYATWEVKLGDIDTVHMQLPLACFMSGGIIEYDYGFTSYTGLPFGMLKIGEIGISRNGYYHHLSYEELFKKSINNDTIYPIETNENVIGGVYKSDNFLRYIEPSIAINTHNIVYDIKLDEDKFANIYFFVSPDASSEHLEVYDDIVRSIKLVSI